MCLLTQINLIYLFMTAPKQLKDIFLISNRKFGDSLRQLLTYLRVTQTDLAKMMDVNRTVISRIVNQHSNPRRKTIDSIEQALNKYMVKFDYSLIQDVGQWYIESAFGEKNSNFKSAKDAIEELKNESDKIQEDAPGHIDKKITLEAFEKIKEQYVYLIISLNKDSALEKKLFSHIRKISTLREEYDQLSTEVLKILENKTPAKNNNQW